MSLDITNDLGRVEQTDYETRQQLLRDILQAEFPNMDLSPGGVFDALLFRGQGLLMGVQDIYVEDWRNSSSLKAIQDNPDTADDTMVDLLFSNYRAERVSGTQATGKIVVVISQSVSTPVPAGTVATAAELDFNIQETFVGTPNPEAVVSDTDRIITRRSDGNYSFKIDAVASSTGADYQVSQDTPFTLDPVPQGFIYAYAESDFTGGTDTETNAEMVERLRQSLASTLASGRDAVVGKVQAQFPQVVDASITGHGQAEMTRDSHALLPFSSGSKADVFVKTRSYPLTETITKTATLVDTASHLWEVALSSEESAGLYGVLRVSRVDSESSSLTLVNVNGTISIPTTEEIIPTIVTEAEGYASAYMTYSVQFTDPDDDGQYDVSVLKMPDIDDINAYVRSSELMPPSSDYIARGPIPCMLSINVEILSTSSETIDAAAVRTAIATRVNGLGFRLDFPISVICSAIYSVIGVTGELQLPMDVTGTLYGPDNVTEVVASTNEIVFDEDPEENISENTVMFMVDPSNIGVTIL